MNPKIVAFFAAALLAKSAYADLWYVTVGGGYPRSATHDAPALPAGFNELASSTTRTGASFALGAGYRLAGHFAVEATYIDLGELHHDSKTGLADSPARDSHVARSWEAAGFGLSLVGSLPITSSFHGLLKGSLYRLAGEFKTSTAVTTYQDANRTRVTDRASTTFTSEGSGVLGSLGLGLSYVVDKHITVRALYERWSNRAGLFGPGNDLRGVSLLSLDVVIAP